MDWKYIAGYFDADGNMHVLFNVKKVTFQAQFRIYSTNKKVLNKIKSFIGFGGVYLKKRTKKNELLWSPCYVYLVGKKSEVRIILEKIAPYLIGKKEQVDYLLKNFNFGRNTNKGFSLKKFRKPITRKGIEKMRKY